MDERRNQMVDKENIEPNLSVREKATNSNLDEYETVAVPYITYLFQLVSYFPSPCSELNNTTRLWIPPRMFSFVGISENETSKYKCLLGCTTKTTKKNAGSKTSKSVVSDNNMKIVSVGKLSRFNARRHIQVIF